METILEQDSLSCMQYTLWSGVPGLVQGISLRAAGRGHGEGLPFLADFLRERGLRDAFRLKQVHGQRVVDVKLLDGVSGGRFSMLQSLEGDGLAGVEAGLAGVVSAADCTPVFILSRRARAWALLHAGWRGVAAGVLQAGLDRLRDLAGTDPSELEIYLGPSICGACYEVGREVAVWLGVRGEESPGFAGMTERGAWRVDIRAVLAHQARSLGTPPENIGISRWCTRCNNDLFHSFRAEGKAALGRMWAFMGFSS